MQFRASDIAAATVSRADQTKQAHKIQDFEEVSQASESPDILLHHKELC